MRFLGRLPLTILIQRDFPSSEAFIEDLGWWVSEEHLFIPTTQGVKPGKTIAFSFTLRKEREILKGKGEVCFVSDGTKNLPAGWLIRITELTPRSQTNLKMILDWQKEHPSPPHEALSSQLPRFLPQP